MQHLLSIIAAATTFATASPDTGAVAMSSPIAVSTCSVQDTYDYAGMADFGPPIAVRQLQLTFRNTADAVATQVTFDVAHGGEHIRIVDRGRFSKGVPIEHVFDAFAGGFSRGPDVCAVASITFADGGRWVAPQ